MGDHEHIVVQIDGHGDFPELFNHTFWKSKAEPLLECEGDISKGKFLSDSTDFEHLKSLSSQHSINTFLAEVVNVFWRDNEMPALAQKPRKKAGTIRSVDEK